MISTLTMGKSIKSSQRNLEWILLVLSSFLLGIWAVKGTIALRHILLAVGSLLSIYYIALEYKCGTLNKQITFRQATPFVLLMLVFFWVIAHYFFLSIDPISQLKELKSTWFRALLASTVGLGTGLALRKHPNRLNMLWCGIFITFLILFYQYVPRAISQNKLFVPDHSAYLFNLKINIVLMGMILITGIDGALLDHLRAVQYRWSDMRFWYLLFWLLGTSLSLWAFVYIANARNGIGLTTILYSFWFICALVFFIQSQIYRLNLMSLLALLFTSICLCLVLYFALLQSDVNKGWHSLLKDVKLAVQIDRYPNWQNLDEMGYPKHEDGRLVTTNTYERVAFASAGSRAILAYPQGVGVLAYPLAKHPQRPPKMMVGPNANGIATHSGWVELGLAFGIPMLGLIFSILLITFIEAARQNHPARMTVLGFVVTIMCLYTVGEAAIQHGLEILFFLLALMPALTHIESKQ